MLSLSSIVFVAIGGAIGASLRYSATIGVTAWLGKGFPYTTLLVNILGSFIMGLLFSLIEHGIVAELPWRPLIGVGILGALTTFSTFSLDTLLMLQNGEWQKALINILLNVLVCILAAWLGMQLVPNRT
ncbi:fluoride efflux transporter CrcB [Psychrosphaera sp. B3R10]|uniref:fluoride efflux transporter CrcB n=1 Tax=unclassified Psychrosphaera TaxID=2641570 RepID=UPI001C0A4E3D|nr:fluoride efflux transporter CrcB [Psychrosphaera sp. 1_MG-2023]MBU2881330.1 fluoride efflux transporter CrcB [Psychrosphaera sp. I2R16]MBU2988429.1 fluoride efflux transporter CrcB [Psychrosphaera sp. B3R10]MDO6720071.1 fluoride efflux transporter CrcB [Psychrosphaera sp. 1_MG-2023]